jgi:hypothetical protein
VHQTHSWVQHVLGATRQCMGAGPMITKPCPTRPKPFDKDAGQYCLPHGLGLLCTSYAIYGAVPITDHSVRQTHIHKRVIKDVKPPAQLFKKGGNPKPTGGGQNSQPVLDKPFDSRMLGRIWPHQSGEPLVRPRPPCFAGHMCCSPQSAALKSAASHMFRTNPAGCQCESVCLPFTDAVQKRRSPCTAHFVGQANKQQEIKPHRDKTTCKYITASAATSINARKDTKSVRRREM